MVAHVRQLSAGLSSVELAMQFAGFIAEVKAKVGATWLPVYTCCDVTKDRTVVDRLVEFGMGGTRNTGSVRLPQLTGVLFGGIGQQVSEAQPLFITLPGRGRFAVPVKHVPKILMFTGLLALGVAAARSLQAAPSLAPCCRNSNNWRPAIWRRGMSRSSPAVPRIMTTLPMRWHWLRGWRGSTRWREDRRRRGRKGCLNLHRRRRRGLNTSRGVMVSYSVIQRGDC